MCNKWRNRPKWFSAWTNLEKNSKWNSWIFQSIEVKDNEKRRLSPQRKNEKKLIWSEENFLLTKMHLRFSLVLLIKWSAPSHTFNWNTLFHFLWLAQFSWNNVCFSVRFFFFFYSIHNQYKWMHYHARSFDFRFLIRLNANISPLYKNDYDKFRMRLACTIKDVTILNDWYFQRKLPRNTTTNIFNVVWLVPLLLVDVCRYFLEYILPNHRRRRHRRRSEAPQLFTDSFVPT